MGGGWGGTRMFVPGRCSEDGSEGGTPTSAGVCPERCPHGTVVCAPPPSPAASPRPPSCGAAGWGAAPPAARSSEGQAGRSSGRWFSTALHAAQQDGAQLLLQRWVRRVRQRPSCVPAQCPHRAHSTLPPRQPSRPRHLQRPDLIGRHAAALVPKRLQELPLICRAGRGAAAAWRK